MVDIPNIKVPPLPISVRLDMDNGSLKFYTNNTLVHTDTTIPTDGTVIFPMQNATNSGVSRHNASIVNFGQDGRSSADI